MTDVISFGGVTKRFPGRRKEPDLVAVDDVSLAVPRGSIVGVIGYSGAGKSTLVRLINGLERPSAGTVNVLGVDVGTAGPDALRALRGRIGMIFQQFNLFGARTVRGNVSYPLRVAGWKRADIDARVDELLDFVGIRDKADQYPRRLSGGQKQRVGIARAIATNPEILLADEATSALDPQTTSEVLALLKQINRRLGVTIVVITHQISIVHELCDQVIVMDGGRVVDGGEKYRVFAHPEAALTERFVAAVTQGVPAGDTLDALLSGGGVLVSADVNEVTTDDIAAALDAHGLHGTVVYGGVTDVLGRQLGTLTYRIRADEQRVRAAAAELAERTRVAVFVSGPESPADAAGGTDAGNRTDAVGGGRA